MIRTSSKVTIDLSGLKKLKSNLKKLESKEVEWGFLYGTHSKADMSYAALAWLLEEGVRSNSGGWSIPPRPAFKNSIASLKFSPAYEQEISPVLQKYLYGNTSVNNVLNETGEYAVQLHKDTMTSWLSSGSQYRHNSPVTIALKGFDMPFVETGELVQNVKYQIT